MRQEHKGGEVSPEEVTLKQYFDLRTQEVERRVESLEGIVERIRQQYISEAQYDRRHEVLVSRVETIERWQANILGRYVGIAIVGAVFIAVIAGFASHLITS